MTNAANLDPSQDNEDEIALLEKKLAEAKARLSGSCKPEPPAPRSETLIATSGMTLTGSSDTRTDSHLQDLICPQPNISYSCSPTLLFLSAPSLSAAVSNHT
jgi:hypothetical protein